MRGRLLALVGIAALTSGYSVDQGGRRDAPASAASVTRFHLGGSIAHGEIRVEPMDPVAAQDPNFPRYAAAVEAQLQANGWTIARGNARSEQVALVRTVQATREEVRRRSGFSFGFGIGGGFGGRHGGGGLGVGATVPVTGGARVNQVVQTQLEVRLQRRSDGTTIWEGRAQDEARGGAVAADPGLASERLAPLLFRGFPGESGRTIRVR